MQVEIATDNTKAPSREKLAEYIFADIAQALNIGSGNLLYRFLNRIGTPAALRFAEILRHMDQVVAEKSVHETAVEALSFFTDGWDFRGTEQIPREGPLLVVANHPGTADSISAVGAVGRRDVSMVAGKRPMLEVLPNLRRYLLFLDKDPGHRMGIMRQIIQKLKEGQSVVIFPRGLLEPDPALIPGALESLKNWSDSVGVFLNKVPETRVQPLLISQTVAPKAWQSLLVACGDTPKKRQQIAMIWQFAMQRLSRSASWKIPVRVDAGQAIQARDLSGSLDPREISEGIKSSMASLLRATYPGNL